ncbi:MAG TPA: metalloregulator ArsR/SmtB family transcription factor [Gemmatimonadales bacterium]|nr:metalloregulator ArsR/SmtB family transcription factor [Gemmatimonadales bacterium]
MQTRRAPIDPRHLADFAALIRVLAHPVRLRLVELLADRGRTVSSLQQALGERQAIVSQQLARLRAAGVVSCRREGTSVWYTLADPRVLSVLDCLRNCENSAARRRLRRATRFEESRWTASRS